MNTQRETGDWQERLQGLRLPFCSLCDLQKASPEKHGSRSVVSDEDRQHDRLPEEHGRRVAGGREETGLRAGCFRGWRRGEGVRGGEWCDGVGYSAA